MFVDPIEGFWFVVNAIAVAFAAAALQDALADRRAIKAANGRAREIVGDGNVRREILRLVISILLVIVIIPGLFVDRPVNLTFPVLALMAVPFLLTANAILDARERRRLSSILATDIAEERRQKLRDLPPGSDA